MPDAPITTPVEQAEGQGTTASILPHSGVLQVSVAPQALVEDYTVYATSPDEFRTWVDELYGLWKKTENNVFFTAVVFGVTIYAGGLFIAYSINFGYNYVQSWAVYVGTAGIIWTVALIRYGSYNIHYAYEELRPCFLITDDEYSGKIHHWFSRLKSHRANFIAAMGWFVLALIVVGLAYYAEPLLDWIHLRALRNSIFDVTWFSPPNKDYKALIIVYFALAVAFPLATSFRLLLINVLFLISLKDYPVIPSVNIIRNRLRPVTDLYIRIALSWFVGVSLFGAVFFTSLTDSAIIFLGVLSFAGLATFFTPQYVFRQYLVQSYRRTCDIGLYSLAEELGIQLTERLPKEERTRLSADLPYTKLSYAEISEVTTPGFLWVYDLSDVILLLIAQLIAVASVYFQGILTP